MKKTLLRKPDFIAFIMNRLQENAPDTRFEPGEDELTFHLIEASGEPAGTLWLHNIWQDYQRYGDINNVIDFINGQIEAFQYVKQIIEQPTGVNIFNVYPAIRPFDYDKGPNNPCGESLNDNSVPGLSTVFLERKEGFMVVLNESLVKPVLVYMNQEEIKMQAYDNLRKKGWVAAHKSIAAMNPEENGVFHMFESPHEPFHHQFFMSDMSSTHLPKSFLVIFSGQNTAVVLTVESEIQSAYQAKQIAIKSGMIYFAKYAYAADPRPLSKHIYWVQGNKRYWLKGVQAKYDHCPARRA